MAALSSKERLLNLILKTSPNPVESEALVLGEPMKQCDCGIPRNTKILVLPASTSGYTGKRTFYYDRVNLSKLISGVDERLPFQLTSEETSLDLLAEFNRRYCTALTAEDIVDEPLPAYRNDCMSYVFKARDTSYAWVGCKGIRLIRRDVKLAWAVTRNVLPDFPPPLCLTAPPKALPTVVQVVTLDGLSGSL